MPERLTHGAFAKQLQTRFRIRWEGAPDLTIVLADVSPLQTSPYHEQFAIVFRGPLEVPLEQQIYRLEHDAMGAFDLFLVPIGRDQHGYSYEAVFSRLIDKQ